MTYFEKEGVRKFLTSFGKMVLFRMALVKYGIGWNFLIYMVFFPANDLAFLSFWE